jgi:hypothetical protein
MHYNFLFNGCSWTYGSELEGLNKDKEHQRTHRFSHLVAENLGMTYDNISKGGVSNDWIVEKTIEWFNTGNTCDIAIIQFTSVNRTIWYNEDDKNKEYSFTPVLSCNGVKIYPEHISLKCSLYYKTFYSDFLGYQNFYKNIFLLENYFTSNNIKFVFVSIDLKHPNNSKSNWKNFCNTEDIKNIRDIIGVKNNHGFDYLHNENYCKDLTKRNAFLAGSHPSEIGHQKIADYIITEIKNASFI